MGGKPVTDKPIIRTADICDDNGDDVLVCEIAFKDYAKHNHFHGTVVTFATFEDNKGVRAVLAEGGQGKVLVVDGQGSRLEFPRQVLALDQLHYNKALPLGLAESVDRGDVAVVERGQQLRLALEPRDALGVRGERLGQELDRDLAIELCVERLPHDTHPALAELLDDLVVR